MNNPKPAPRVGEVWSRANNPGSPYVITEVIKTGAGEVVAVTMRSVRGSGAKTVMQSDQWRRFTVHAQRGEGSRASKGTILSPAPSDPGDTPCRVRLLALMAESGIDPACIELVDSRRGRAVSIAPAACRARDWLAYELRRGPTPDLCFTGQQIAAAMNLRDHTTALGSASRERARRGAAKATGGTGSSATFQNAPTPQTGSTAARGRGG